MIYQGSAGQENAIFRLLTQEYPASQARAWMKTKYNPKTMLYWKEENGKVPAFLQIQPRTMLFEGKKAAVQVLDTGILETGSDPAIMSALLEAAMALSKKNSLFCAISSRSTQNLKNMGFLPLCTHYRAWISQQPEPADEDYSLSSWDGEDLYPLYRRFQSLFDGSILLEEQQFAAAMSCAIMNQCKILVIKRKDKIIGFAILDLSRADPAVKLIVYEDLQGLQALMYEVWNLYGPFWLYASGSEPREYIWPDLWKPLDTFFLKINDLDAFGRFAGRVEEDSACYFEGLSKPSWNFLL